MTSTQPVTPRYALTVLIASHNRRDLLQRCLDALRQQTQDPGTFEVIVADNGSDDGTAEMVEGLKTPFDLRVLRLKQAGQSPALNAALQAAEGRTCLFLDDDVIVSPGLVAEHLMVHQASPNAVAFGRLIQQPPAARDWYAHAYARAWNEHYREFSHRPPTWADCYGGNLSVLRRSLIDAGGFAADLRSGYDVELAFRLCRAGGVPKYLHRAEAVHDDQKPAARILDHAQRDGAGSVEIVNRHPAAEAELLGSFRAAERREIVLRRLLIALRFPPGPLVLFGRLVPGLGRKMFWFQLVYRLAFWAGVRRQVARSRWRGLTRAGTGAVAGASPAQPTS